MDLLKTPSVQSLLDSDLESVGSLQYLDIEELDEIEYALPSSEAPSLAEVLSADDEETVTEPLSSLRLLEKSPEEPSSCSALQVDFLQGVSQQLIQAQERSSRGAVTALSVGKEKKLTVGTSHGQLLSFQDQTLRWVCDSNTDRGAVSCLAYSQDSSRLLVGFARGLICQYESTRGVVLRKVTLGGETWGILKVTWAGTSGLALDTGGSVWLIRFSRPLGVRSARTSCLFSGARGEVVALKARDARILALATLSRVIIVAGGKAAGIRVGGTPDTLPVLEWSESDEMILVCARAKVLQWLSVTITGSSISLRPVHRVDLLASPLWMGWLGGSLAIIDSHENIRLWGDDYEKPLDLSHIEPVYASAFFKGVWTDGRVSRAMCSAGEGALGGACISEGSLYILGRKGVLRVRPRDLLGRAQAFIDSGRHIQALRLLCSAQGNEAKAVAVSFVIDLSDRPHVLRNKQVADQVVRLCVKYNLSEELWSNLWEGCSGEQAFVEALGDAAVRGELGVMQPSPDSTQALIEALADFEPSLVERVVASLPLTSLDPHRASVFTRQRGLWRGVGAIAAALGGSVGAMRELVRHVSPSCAGGGECACGGRALVLAAADSLGGRGAAGTLPSHARPSASHHAITALLHHSPTEPCILQVLVKHDAVSAMLLLNQCSREPPFAGPLAKQNRLKVARALLSYMDDLQKPDDQIEVLEFIAGQLNSGALPSDEEVIKGVLNIAATTTGERSDRAWLALLTRAKDIEQMSNARESATQRPRVLWRLDTFLNRHEDVVKDFLKIDNPSRKDIDELFEYLRSRAESNGFQLNNLQELIELRPQAAAALIDDRSVESIADILLKINSERVIEFGSCLLESGRLEGNVAAAHFQNLCKFCPKEITAFLSKNPGVVRPEDALRIVKEFGIEDAEAMCLEAVGDPQGALDAILRLIQSRPPDEEARLISEASSLCFRTSSVLPSNTAAEMWAKLLKQAKNAPPTVLLDAAAYLPVDELLNYSLNGQSYDSSVAMSILECAKSRMLSWRCAAAVASREAHERARHHMVAANRALAGRGRCRRCGGDLHTRPAVRTGHCGRVFHADCEAETMCGCCGRRVPDTVVSLPQRSHRNEQPPPQSHALVLMAPPRPDLEGIV